jgi:hypothetical protein
MRHLLSAASVSLLLALATAPPAMTEVIDFESQTSMRGGNLTGIPDSPLTIGSATFTGGELLNGEVGLNADQTGVYATEGLFGSGDTNPLVITFSSPVSGFSIYVVNGGAAQSYTVSDNLGDSVTTPLASASDLGARVFSLPESSISTVDITSLNGNDWNFAIDNVSFIAATPVPEPGPHFLLAAGAVLMAAVLRTRTHPRR